MYLIAKFGGHRFYGNGDINSYLNNSQKSDLTASVHHIERFTKSGLSIYDSKVPDSAGAKKREEEEESRQLQSLTRITQTQKCFLGT